jgi:(1->4)-alpha-D-glucan 1-alpha-D-glucosylmutase
VEAWSRLNAGFRSPVNGNPAPDRNDEYFIYQTLVGFWPEGKVFESGRLNRLKSYLTKAMREAKTHSSWIHNNELYESAVHNFVDRVLAGPGAGPFLKSFSAFLNRVAAPGVWNSLSQVVLKNTSPGVPDLYQGNEGWDFHLADPDNRRPVDFKSRLNALEALASVEALPPRERGPALANLAGQWGDGRIKLFVTAAMLRFRRKYSDLFLHGDYVPLLLGRFETNTWWPLAAVTINISRWCWSRGEPPGSVARWGKDSFPTFLKARDWPCRPVGPPPGGRRFSRAVPRRTFQPGRGPWIWKRH